MRKKLLLALVLSALSLSAYSAEVQYPNREFYGFFLSNNEEFTNAPLGSYGFGSQTFADMSSNKLLYGFGGDDALYAAAAIDGLYYAAPYHYNTMNFPTPLPMITYNIYTGELATLGDWIGEDKDFKINDMSYDLKNDRLLAIGYGPVDGAAIYEVNRKNGSLTLLRHISGGGGTIACDAHGRVFSMGNDGDLYQIDMTRDNHSIKLLDTPFDGMMAKQSMEFDLTCNKLYWGANTLTNPTGDRGSGTWLVEITLPAISPDIDYSPDTTGYGYELIGQIGSYARFTGLYIPYCVGGFKAPGFATDIKTEPSADGTSCKIVFTAPTKAFDGETDTTVDGFDIYREGVRIHTGKGISAGQQVEYTDNSVPASGIYKYDIVCYSNTQGDGPKTPVYIYIGYDRPAAATNIVPTVADDFKSVVVTWDAPLTGAQGGTFNPAETRYDVKRLPDNYVVATDLTDTKFTDTFFRRLLRYTYQITAKNSVGETTIESPSFIAGPAITDLPLEEAFENPTALVHQWTLIDNNNDGYTWLLGADYGHSIFGDYEMTAEYFISPTTADENLKDADEWIIAPPVAFPADGSYEAIFSIRSLAPENLNVYVGPRPEIEGMTKVGSFNLREPEYAGEESGSRMIFQDYTVALPADIAGTTACVALQLATPVNSMRYSYMQLGSFTVGEGTAGVSLPTVGCNVSVTVAGDVITIAGDFDKAALYNARGIKVMDICSASTSLSGLSKGVYILNIDGRGYKIAL